MALEISLAQFNKIATGDYNAGQIDIRTSKGGQAELVKVNSHVWQTSKNKVVLSPERILAPLTRQAVREIRSNRPEITVA